jgi:hypothetical protein
MAYKKKGPKVYTLQCGMKVTADMVVQKTSVKRGTARRRLQRSDTYDLIFAPKSKKVGHIYAKNQNPDKKIDKPRVRKSKYRAALEKRIIATQPFYNDPMYRLALITI